MGLLPDWLHTGLDYAGMVPKIGAIPDLINAGLYLSEAGLGAVTGGDWKGPLANAGLSGVAAIPYAGDAAMATKLALKGGRFAKNMRGYGGATEQMQEAGVNPILASILASAGSGGLTALGTKPMSLVNFGKAAGREGLQDLTQNLAISGARQASPTADWLLGIPFGEDMFKPEPVYNSPDYFSRGSSFYPDPAAEDPAMDAVQRRLEYGSYWNA